MSMAASKAAILTVITGYTPRIVPADRVSVALLNESGDSLEVFALQGVNGVFAVGEQVPVAGTQIGRAVQEMRLLREDDLLQNPTPDALKLTKLGLRSNMNAPLMLGERVLGALNVGSKKPGLYSTRDEVLLMQIATFLATTLENTRLYTEAQPRARQPWPPTRPRAPFWPT